MPVSQHLLRKLQQTLGSDAAGDLVRMLDSSDASRGDVGELRHDMQLGFERIDARFAQMEAKFDAFRAQFDTLRSAVGENMERGLREQTRFFFLAWSVLLAAIVGLYAK